MSDESKPNNRVNEVEGSREGVSPSKCPIGRQDETGCHRSPVVITAGKGRTRRKLPQEENR